MAKEKSSHKPMASTGVKKMADGGGVQPMHKAMAAGKDPIAAQRAVAGGK